MATTKTITFNFENRNIRAGEYGAAFGHSKRIAEIVLSPMYLPVTRSMTLTHTSTSATITYTGKLGTRMLDALSYLFQKGIITDLSY